LLAFSFRGFPVMIDVANRSLGVEEPCAPLIEGDVVEVPLLLPGWQALFLETVAHQRGMTAAAMVRHLLRDFLIEAPSPRRMPSP
jgi:hypothetical protein